jgi:hypothetical protein
MEVKAPPPVVLPFSWSGCYVGGNAGWIRNDSTERQTGRSLSPGVSGRPVGGDVQPTGPFRARLSGHGQRSSRLPGKRQLGVRLEGDFNWSGIKDTVNASFPDIVVGGGSFWQQIRPSPIVSTGSQRSVRRSAIRSITSGVRDWALPSAASVILLASVSRCSRSLRSGISSADHYGFTLGGGLNMPSPATGRPSLNTSSSGFVQRPRPFQLRSQHPMIRVIWTTTFKTREHVLRLGLNYRFRGLMIANC